MLGGELRNPGALFGGIEAALGGGGELLEDEAGVADDADFGGAIVADLLAVEIDVDELCASAEKRGARRKESIELARAPITRTTSASRKAVERAAGNERADPRQ